MRCLFTRLVPSVSSLTRMSLPQRPSVAPPIQNRAPLSFFLTVPCYFHSLSRMPSVVVWLTVHSLLVPASHPPEWGHRAYLLTHSSSSLVKGCSPGQSPRGRLAHSPQAKKPRGLWQAALGPVPTGRLRPTSCRRDQEVAGAERGTSDPRLWGCAPCATTRRAPQGQAGPSGAGTAETGCVPRPPPLGTCPREPGA